jgi:5-dehydro-2-deoxygluconokinase
MMPLHYAPRDAQTAATANLVYDGLQMALAAGALRESAGIICETALDATILRDAAARGIVTTLALQRIGEDEFSFEKHFERSSPSFHPTFYKATVRYNPAGDRTLNNKRAIELSRLSQFLASLGQSRLMLELLIPPVPGQVEEFAGGKKAYDVALRPHLMIEAIRELQDAGVDPDVWAVDGMVRREDYESLVMMLRSEGRNQAACIVNGDSEPHQGVRGLLEAASEVPGIIGFALGRTDLSDPLTAWRMRRATRDQAVAVIAARYLEFADLCEASCGERSRRAAGGRVWPSKSVNSLHSDKPA